MFQHIPVPAVPCRHSPEGLAYWQQLLAMADALMAVAKAPAAAAATPTTPPPANITQLQQQVPGPAIGSAAAAAAGLAGQGAAAGPGCVLLQLLDVLLPELAKMGQELTPHTAGEQLVLTYMHL